MGIYIIHPKIPCICIYAFCIIIHLIVALYGSVQVVWYPITYGFMMCIIYIVAIVSLFLRRKLLYFILAAIMAGLLLILFVFWILAVYMTAAQPVEGKDIMYRLFPQNGNYIETYKTLSIATLISSMLLLFVNTLGLLAALYALFHSRKYEDDQVVTRGL